MEDIKICNYDKCKETELTTVLHKSDNPTLRKMLFCYEHKDGAERELKYAYEKDRYLRCINVDIRILEQYQSDCVLCGMSIDDPQYIKMTEQINEMRKEIKELM